MKNRSALFILLALFISDFFSQNKYDKSFYLIDIKSDFVFEKSDKQSIDSLLHIYHNSKKEVIRLGILKSFSESLISEYLWTNYNHYLYNITLNKTDSLNKVYNGAALNNLGYEAQYITNDLVAAKKYYHLAYDLYKSINELDGTANVLNNLGYLYQHSGNVQKSIELYSEAGKIFLQLNQPKGLAVVYVNLGTIYYQNDDNKKAEAFFNSALKYSEHIDDKITIAGVYNQLAVINSTNKNFELSKAYSYRALDIYEAMNDNCRSATIYTVLSISYFETKDKLNYDKYSLKAEEYGRLCGDLRIKSDVYDFVASYYLSIKNDQAAFIYADSAYSFAKEVKDLNTVKKSASKLSVLYKRKGDYAKAYTYLEEVLTISNKIYNDESQKSILESQYKFEYDKKEIQLKTEEDKKDIIRKAEKQKQRLILIATIIALLLTFGVLYFVYRNYKAKQKSSRILEEQNKIILAQKDLVEEKNKEIMESILYSKYLQTAILPKEEQFNKISKINFLKYQPKDIVSGDYYWTYNTPNGLCIWATMDCTGHGVPGAMMSMLGVSLLNEIVIEKHIYQPNEILNRLRERIISALNLNESSDLKDGMDGSVCIWDKVKNTFTYASANSSIWIFREEAFIELKYNKMPIGKHIVMEPFQLFSFDLMPNDWVISMSDGLADQFGGPENKKLKYKRVREFLTKKLVLADHHVILPDLKEFYQDWKGLNEQTDDVTVLGIKIS
jgi:serine phosphatase RsbU (regulator of sigma subunit)